LRGRNQTVNNLTRRLRRAETDAEKVLWGCLRNRALGGHKFVRQAPVGKYIVDFLCRERKLVVEADGSQHYDSERDQSRDAWLHSQGYAVLRLSNSIILGQRPSAIETITAALDGTLEATAGYEISFKSPAS
jgi:very-short-patch-repair endonuclease